MLTLPINNLGLHERSFVTKPPKHNSPSLSNTFGRTPLTPIHPFSILNITFQHHTSDKGRIRGVLEQTESEGPLYLAFIHLFFA
ncbi:hypothetical protein Hanom_Chr01g00048581 [Helianthus anomalus]